MDALAPVAGLDALDRHLDALLALPPTAPTAAPAADADAVRLDPALFDAVELQLTDANSAALAPRLLPKAVALLQHPAAIASAPRGNGPAVVCALAGRLLGPVPFDAALGLASEDVLVAALSADAAAATSVLAMDVVHKAAALTVKPLPRRSAQAAANLARLAGMGALLEALVVRWLAAPAVEVGERGSRVLGDLLDMDCPLPVPAPPAQLQQPGRHVNGSLSGIVSTAPPPPVLTTLRNAPGRGVLWRRFLADGRAASLVAAAVVPVCRGTHPAVAGNAHQQTIAQGRLLRLLPRLAALHLAAVASPASAGGGSRTDSLLHFAALHMVDTSDVLMHRSLVDFFEALVSVLRLAAEAAADGAQADYIAEVLRTLLRAATAGDAELLHQLQTLPERTAPEEADALRAWLRQVLPGTATRVAGWA